MSQTIAKPRRRSAIIPRLGNVLKAIHQPSRDAEVRALRVAVTRDLAALARRGMASVGRESPPPPPHTATRHPVSSGETGEA